ncbi:ATP-binding cassette domain-containing protein [Chitiniphilus purpureus]|uniref:ATP-binding cassette domain-containing protein n=1 Tax=Chitiniphilus purpureus TaxID=2981137 RepID=A0ABY6DN66_9NEIS|nr:ATP-binding cassette domain-containing protein [Chitiniphilus sp. CD1]UXY15809.1 ATP-binding cassette domain-containing protein [Chitiniphilus sp. CD1]
MNRFYQSPCPSQCWSQRLRRLWQPEYITTHSVRDINFNIESGECVALVGPNGAGKSTTIKMLTGILAPSSGTVTVAGFDPQRQRRDYVRHIGVVFGQRSQLWWDLPVEDSFRILQALFSIPDSVYKRQLTLFRREADLDQFWRRPARTLSLGQRMLCEIAASFLHSPTVAFLDEPTIGLDLEMKARMRSLIRQLNREAGTTVLITSHDVGDIEQLSQRLLLIDNGQLKFDGSLPAFHAYAGEGNWWAVRLSGDLSAAQAVLSAHNSGLPVRVQDDWLQVARHDSLPFAELLQLLAPFAIHEIKPVAQSLEELLHRYYLTGKEVQG